MDQAKATIIAAIITGIFGLVTAITIYLLNSDSNNEKNDDLTSTITYPTDKSTLIASPVESLTPVPVTRATLEAIPTSFDQPTNTLSMEITPSEQENIALTDIPRRIASVTSNNEWIPYSEIINGVEMVLVPTGCFMMGSAPSQISEAIYQCNNFYGSNICDGRLFEIQGEKHQQCFENPFWIDRYEVTNKQYGSYGKWAGDNLPRESVSWFEANEFCKQRDARLPTETEWEYAARGPDNLIYPWGNEFIPGNVVYGVNSGNHTSQVGSRPTGASWVGAMDMSGNVWEWVSSIYMDYPYRSTDGRENNSDNSSYRVLRSGTWGGADAYVRSANRYGDDPYKVNDGIGFRCADNY